MLRRSANKSNSFMSPRDADQSSKRSSNSFNVPETPVPPSKPPKTPREHRSIPNGDNPDIELEEVDEETEKRQRHFNQVVQRQREKFDSPATSKNASKRRIDTTEGSESRSNAEISDHYSKCIKLLTENKISNKNAFSLHLIDLLPDLLRDKESSEGRTNFQVAGTSLDASAKIYSYRVDIVHQATYQMVGGLGKVDSKKGKRDHKDDEDDDSFGGLAEEESGPSKGPRKKKPKIRGRTLTDNMNHINQVKPEATYEFDPLFRKVCLAFENKCNGGLLGPAVHLDDDTLHLMLHSFDTHTDVRVSVDGIDRVAEDRAVRELVQSDTFEDLINSVPQLQLTSLCPSLSSHNFGLKDFDESCESTAGRPSDEELGFYPLDPIPDELPGISQAALDTVASVQWPEIDNDLDIDEDDDVATVPDMTDRIDRDDADRRVNYGDIVKAMSSKPLEYSFFSPQAVQTWGGPDNWRVKRTQRNDPSEEDAGKPKKKRRKRGQDDLDFGDDGSVAESKTIDPELQRTLAALFGALTGTKPDYSGIPKAKKCIASTTLSRKVTESYSSQSNLCSPLHYKGEDLTKLYLKDQKMLNKHGTAMTNEDLCIPNYDLNNHTDTLNFIPPGPHTLTLGASPHGNLSSHGGFEDMSDDEDDVTAMVQNAGEDNPFVIPPMEGGETTSGSQQDAIGAAALVDEPVQVQRLNIHYAKRAKRVDVVKLKLAMWKVLTRKEPLQDVSTNVSLDKSTEEERLEHECTFSELCRQVPRYVSPSLAKNLSVPISFVCFLHMCNEKVLELSDNNEISDFLIRQG